jgi:hypothetical protein
MELRIAQPQRYGPMTNLLLSPENLHFALHRIASVEVSRSASTAETLQPKNMRPHFKSNNKVGSRKVQTTVVQANRKAGLGLLGEAP